MCALSSLPPSAPVLNGWNQLSWATGPQQWHYTSIKFPLTFHCCNRVKSQDTRVRRVLCKLKAKAKSAGCLWSGLRQAGSGVSRTKWLDTKAPVEKRIFFLTPPPPQSWDKSQSSVLLNRKQRFVSFRCSLLTLPGTGLPWRFGLNFAPQTSPVLSNFTSWWRLLFFFLCLISLVEAARTHYRYLFPATATILLRRSDPPLAGP